MSDDTSDPARIERDLQRRRSSLDTHLDELQQRFSPGQLMDEGLAYLRGSQGKEFMINLGESIREKPLPAALAGIGLAWLMASGPGVQRAGGDGTYGRDSYGRTSRGPGEGMESVTVVSPHHYDDLSFRVRSAGDAVARGENETDDIYHDRVNEARGRVLGLTRQAQETAQSYAQRIQDSLSSARDGMTRSAHDLRDKAGDMAGGLRDRAADMAGSLSGRAGDLADRASGLGGAIGDQARSAANRLSSGTGGSDMLSSLTDSPVLLGALGIAAGALLGLIVPRSEHEDEYLGGIAGQARDALSGVAQEAMERGGRVAQATLQAGQESLQDVGKSGVQSPSDLADGAKKIAQTVLRAGDEAVRKEGLGQEPGQEGGQPGGAARSATSPGSPGGTPPRSS